MARRAAGPTTPIGPGEPRYQALRALLSEEITPQQVIDDLQASGLRGMGGAGFPTGKKWELVRGEEAVDGSGIKYAICNADESEPGTFKDRQLLAEQPHLVLEGLLMGHGRHRRRGGLGLHPARVRPGGGGAARRDRESARAGPDRRRRAAAAAAD